MSSKPIYKGKQCINYCPKCGVYENKIEHVNGEDFMVCSNCSGRFKIVVCSSLEHAEGAPIVIIDGKVFYKVFNEN